MTALRWLVSSFYVYFAFLSFGTIVPWPEVGLIPIISSLAAYLPVSIGGIGTVEYAATYLFDIIGIRTEIVITAFLLMRVLTVIQLFVMHAVFSFLNRLDGNS